MPKIKKSYYKSKKEKEFEAAQKLKATSTPSLSTIPELRRHIVRKHEDGTNINIYESYIDPKNPHT
jgi:hypothetical protein